MKDKELNIVFTAQKQQENLLQETLQAYNKAGNLISEYVFERRLYKGRCGELCDQPRIAFIISSCCRIYFGTKKTTSYAAQRAPALAFILLCFR